MRTNNIKLLDCTLRDGGYINNWVFGKTAIHDIKNKLELSGVDIIELGFLRDDAPNADRTVFNSIDTVKKLIGQKQAGKLYAVMAEVSNPFPLEKLAPYDENSPEVIRVIVWKRMLKEGFEYCKGIVEKGYKLCVQPARVSQYSDEEFVDMIKKFNELNPMAIYVVDSWGTMYKEELLHYLKLADENLKDGISVGYHGHNNLMQAMDVAQAFCEFDLKRDLIIDASIYGIGRGAGNLNTELFAMWANKYLNKSYDLSALMSIYDMYIKQIYDREGKWGYSIPYLITAKYNANPNYARYYEKLGASCEFIEKCIGSLSSDEKIIFKEDIANKYYKSDENHRITLRNYFKSKYDSSKPYTENKKYNGYNFELKRNHFSLYDNVKSNQLYGSQDKIGNPFITVVIPTYKRTDLLKEAIYSVLSQVHVDFEWNIIIMDNEPYDGKANENQRYIESLNSDKITYYRNDENLKPSDNFNRGIYLAKAPWVIMLHDDDILMPNVLEKMGNLINYLSTLKGKPLGAIAVCGYQFKHDQNNPEAHKHLLDSLKIHFLKSNDHYNFFELTHTHLLCTGHIGGNIPSNGALYNRDAVIKTGGFNEEAGISADLIFYYCLENNYTVYQLCDWTGFYRWGMNQMSQFKNIQQTVINNNDFREYVFNKNFLNKIYGFLFRNSLYYNFTKDVISMRKVITFDHTNFTDYSNINNNRPNFLMFHIWRKFIHKPYIRRRTKEIKENHVKMVQYLKNKKEVSNETH